MSCESNRPVFKARRFVDAMRRSCGRLVRTALGTGALAMLAFHGRARGSELVFADFNNQGPFNNFSGDSGTFASKPAAINVAFDHRVFHGPNGASLRIDYSVPSGYCGVWFSVVGKAAYPEHTLNFTNLYGSLRNSAGNPSRIENVKVTDFSFWARGDGRGAFDHKVKIEFKSPQGLIGDAVVDVPNGTNWVRCDVPIRALGHADVSRVKQIVFVIEDWRNNHRNGRLYLDDLAFTTDEPPYDPARWSDDAMLDVVSQRAFGYFWRFADSKGFALDRSTYSDMVSVGAIGFQLAAYCIGYERHWAPRRELENRVVRILENLKNIRMGPEPGTVCGGYRGFYYHFLRANTGQRMDDGVELSLYDTALLMYGVLTCQQFFHANTRVQALSQELFDRVQWDWFVDHAPGINTNRFHLAWLPGPTPAGTFVDHVDGQTDEALLVDVLALGSRTHPVSFESYLSRNRLWGAYPPASRDEVMVSWQGSLFNYFFASCWLNFENRGLDLHPHDPRNLWANDKLAILDNRQFCIDHASKKSDAPDDRYLTYGPNAWGLTACDNLVAPSVDAPSEYFAFGALPNEQNIRFNTKALHAGTLAVYGAASAINFVPKAAIAALRHDFKIPGLWSPLFGFGDAFSLDPHFVSGPYDAQGNPTIGFASYLNGPWVDHMVMGIDAGPMLLAIENYRTGLIWKLLGRNPEISAGLERIFGLGAPAKLAVSKTRGERGAVRLQWSAVPGASGYNVYSSPDSRNWNLRQQDVRGTHWTDTTPSKGKLFYCIKAVQYKPPQAVQFATTSRDVIR